MMRSGLRRRLHEQLSLVARQNSMPPDVGFFAPKGTPKDVVAKLNDAMVRVLNEPAIRARFAQLGPDIASAEQQRPEGLAALHKAEIENGGRSSSQPTSKPNRTSAAKLLVACQTSEYAPST
jgi:tripartite tricarboxylate transporter family receptor